MFRKNKNPNTRRYLATRSNLDSPEAAASRHSSRTAIIKAEEGEMNDSSDFLYQLRKELLQKMKRKKEPIDAVMHFHPGVSGDHIHSYGSYLHKHALRSICKQPECKTFPTHKVHNSPNVPL